MENQITFLHEHAILIVLLILWEGIWKLVALWRAGRNNELGWFVAIGVLNTLGILPIIYILLGRKPTNNE